MSDLVSLGCHFVVAIMTTTTTKLSFLCWGADTKGILKKTPWGENERAVSPPPSQLMYLCVTGLAQETITRDFAVR